MGNSQHPEAGVIAAIDALERDAIDELVDWQMSDSPAAVAEHGGNPRWVLSRGSWLLADHPIDHRAVMRLLADATHAAWGELPDDPFDPSAWLPADDLRQFPRYHTGSLDVWRQHLAATLACRPDGGSGPVESLGTVSGTVADSGCGGNVT